IVAALLSFGVQVLAVSVNFVNYEILLRSIYPTDWENPLAFGPPAQSLTDLQYSPVLGQIELIRQGFVGHSDLAWLWPDGNVQWLIVLFGFPVLVTLAAILTIYWLADFRNDSQDREPIAVGLPVR